MSFPGTNLSDDILSAEPPVEADAPPKPKEDDGADYEKPPYDDETLLSMVRVEMQRSVGFENDQTLRSERLRALDYEKGDMKSDIPSLPNRSKAVSLDISEAVDTIMPDLMEIFTGGSDVVSFDPLKPGDEDAARQETDYLSYVIFQQNAGFLELHSAIKDGLLLKTAVFEFDWKTDYLDEEFEGKTAAELMMASQNGHVVNVTAEPADQDNPTAQPTYSFCIRKDMSRAVYWSLPPDDFSVSPDTVQISDTVYCASRYRPRVQDLIAEGYDEAKCLKLEPYAPTQDQELQQSRDRAGEHQQSQQSDTTSEMLRQVEIRKHYIRLYDSENERFGIWRVVTNATADVIIPWEGKTARHMPRVPFAAGSPYLVAHRFYGKSLAEQLFEVQRINTVLTRTVLDSAYFAQNQRFEVSTEAANEYTISDLLRNEPMIPVRSRNGNALRPLASAGLGFDPYAALEYFATVGERRTGVVRNAQGLNPDTLHDTAKGAMALMTAAQRRVRMIARVLAETVIKELYLGLHALIREHAESAVVSRVNGKWIDVDPTQWGERESMTIEVGLGAAGRDADMMAFQVLSQDMAQIVTQQGGLNGPLVTAENVYNLLYDKARALGRKQPERYYADPANAPPQPQAAPPPDPKLVAAKMQQETAQRGQDLSAQVKREQNATEAELKQYEIDTRAHTDVTTTLITDRQHDAIPRVEFGGQTG